jgi:putative phage-type endonuclease
VTALVQVVEQVRGHGIGASMAAACLGCSPYLSPIGAWLQLKGREQKPSGAPAEWGQILEPVIRGYYTARHGYVAPRFRVEVPTASMYRPDLPWLRATPDGIVAELLSPGWCPSHLVQVKTVDQRLGWHWGLNPRIRSAPAHYRIQAVIEMAVTGLARCDFAVLCGGNDYFEVIVERDAELEGAVLEKLAAFWASLDADEPPPLDHADDWRVYFADRLPKQRIQVIAPVEVEQALDAWRAARAATKAAEQAEGLAKNQILAAAAQEQATAFESKHGRVVVVQAKERAPYVKAPTGWAEE